MATTLLSNLVNPQVVADLVQTKLTDYTRFLPLAEVDTTLEGQAGNTLYFPVYSYIGAASVLTENSSLSTVALAATSTSATVVKYAKGVEITDEAALSGFGSPLDEATKQIAMALGDAEDSALLGVLSTITGTMAYSTSTDVAATDILDALELFGEDVDEVKAVVVAPSVYTEMRKASGWLPASEIAANILIKGAVGEFGGCQVIVSNKLTSVGEMYIVKPGALRLVTKKGVTVETDRDILKFTTVITASAHCVAYLYNKAKAIRIYNSNA